MRFQHLCFPLMLLTVILFVSQTVSAQDLLVRSMEFLSNDATASSYDYQLQDPNGEYAGIVKVYVALNDVEFEGGGVLKQEKRGIGEYWVWMAKDSSRLKVRAAGFIPLEVNFRTYDDVNVIHSKSTYKLILTVPSSGQLQQDDGMNYLVLTVKPSNSRVLIDGEEKVSTSENGEYMILLSRGSHSYTVSSPGYAAQRGTVLIGKERQPLDIRLISTKAELKVECPTIGAKVYVNDQLRGEVPWTGSLNAESYRVEVRMDGYRSQSQTVSLSENGSRTLSFPALSSITGSLNVSFSPIGSDVYIDGEKVGMTPDIFRNVGVGSHNVEICKEGFESVSQTVSIEENKMVELSGSLTSMSAQTPVNNINTTATSQIEEGSSQNKTFMVKDVTFTMVYIEGGTFTMGGTSEQGSDALDAERPTHNVTLSSYYIGETEVTQALWQAVMGTTVQEQRDKIHESLPMRGEGSNYPMYYISWEECQEFVRRLNSLTGLQFKLPSEAQWEYAARGGKKSRGYKYSGSNTIGEVAWYIDNSGNTTHPVKTKSPNELGIYDMSGNVSEWCQDWYGSYSSFAQTNPTGASSGATLVTRGGHWFETPRFCQSSFRSFGTPSDRFGDLGLRLAL